MKVITRKEWKTLKKHGYANTNDKGQKSILTNEHGVTISAPVLIKDQMIEKFVDTTGEKRRYRRHTSVIGSEVLTPIDDQASTPNIRPMPTWAMWKCIDRNNEENYSVYGWGWVN